MAKQKAETKWRDRLSRWRRSGKTAAVFCREEDVSTASFYAWRRRLGATPAKRPLEFVEVTPIAEPTASTAIEIQLGGAVVHLPRGFDPADLRAVLAVLRESR